MSDLIVKCDQSAGQVLLLTAAIRDLHRCFPGMFSVDIRTPYPEIWENNPHIVPLNDKNTTLWIECRNSAIQNCNELPFHSVHAYISELNERLKIFVRPTAFAPDVHLSIEEKSAPSPILDAGWNGRYWILHAGVKKKRTVKHWGRARYQQMVDHYRGAIKFVQIGDADDLQPALNGVVDLRGKTTIRELIRLMYHSDGIVTSPGFVMHLAAAIKSKTGLPLYCVVIAGGREPAHWSAYPTHQFIHKIGMLPCCATGGCWRSRVFPEGDGQPEDQPHQLCLRVSEGIAQCMEMIGVQEVVGRIDECRAGEKLYIVSEGRVKSSAGFQLFPEQDQVVPLTASDALRRSEEFIRGLESYPGQNSGRGIVICAGGAELCANAWVCINMLRHLGCKLPIQLWYLGPDEVDRQLKQILEPLGVECVDALEIRRWHPIRRLGGWELKAYAILHSLFKQVLLLDADNVPVLNPEFLFETAEFKGTGALFWPDIGHLKPDDPIWKLSGVPFFDEPEWESGQIVVDKERCWKALRLALWYNEHSDFFYKYILGDKETFHIAFRKLGCLVAIPAHPARALFGALCQHDFEGRRTFQHRNARKWRLVGENSRIRGFQFEEECLQFLRVFRERWVRPDNLISRIDLDAKSDKERDYVHYITSQVYDYVRIGFGERRMTFSLAGGIEAGRAGCEKYWDVREEDGQMVLEIYNEEAVTCRLIEFGVNGDWRGRWLHYDKMPVELKRATNLVESPYFPNGCAETRKNSGERKKILFRTPLNAFTGYGLHAIQIVQDFIRMDYDIRIRASSLSELHAPIPKEVRKHVICRNISEQWDLILCSPGGFSPRTETRSLVFTMWESTRIPSGAVSQLNEAHQIVVPSHWNASCFNACGVNRPISVVPLGINAEIFKYAPMNMDGPCVFGTAGKLESGGMRKGIEEVILAFQKTFPAEKNVRLRIKVFPDDTLPKLDDSRIELTGQYLTEKELAKWYSELTCFVSCSHGEAWGLMLHQALAVGRPVIGALYGGITEFMTADMGYAVDFRLVPARGFYENLGLWIEASQSDIANKMIRVFMDRAETREKGINASSKVSQLTWQNSNAKLLNVMKSIGMTD